MKSFKNFENQVITNLQTIKGGADKKRKFRKPKPAPAIITIDVYESNGGD
jgi:hypothetical protein